MCGDVDDTGQEDTHTALNTALKRVLSTEYVETIQSSRADMANKWTELSPDKTGALLQIVSDSHAPKLQSPGCEHGEQVQLHVGPHGQQPDRLAALPLHTALRGMPHMQDTTCQLQYRGLASSQ